MDKKKQIMKWAILPAAVAYLLINVALIHFISGNYSQTTGALYGVNIFVFACIAAVMLIMGTEMPDE